MKINEGFEVRSVCGEHMMVAMGEKNIDFSHVIAFNETSVFIWNQMLAGKDTIDDVAKALDFDENSMRRIITNIEL